LTAPFILRTIDHVVIRANDTQRLIAFYVEALGCKIAWDRPELGLTHLTAGNAQIDIVCKSGPLGKSGPSPDAGTGKNVDHFCLRIEPFSFESLQAHFQKFGIRLDPPCERFGATGYGPSIYFADPEGNGIELKKAT